MISANQYDEGTIVQWGGHGSMPDLCDDWLRVSLLFNNRLKPTLANPEHAPRCVSPKIRHALDQLADENIDTAKD